MPPPVVVVGGVGAQDPFEMADPVYQDPVQAFVPHRSRPTLGEGLGARRSDRRAITLTPSVRKTSLNAPEYFASRSRTRNRTGNDRSSSSKASFRACWVTQAVVHPPGAQLDEEQDVDRLQPKRLHGEEVARQDPPR
jgi:hypothetical protein